MIKVPSNAIVNLKTHVGLGSVEYPIFDQNGRPSSPFSVVPSQLKSAASQAAAPHLTIDAEVGIGTIWISRSLTSPVKSVAPAKPLHSAEARLNVGRCRIGRSSASAVESYGRGEYRASGPDLQ